MMGTPQEPGMIPRAMDQVFAAAAGLAAQGWRYEMRASMLEIYNEELRDLLGKGPPAGKKHAVGVAVRAGGRAGAGGDAGVGVGVVHAVFADRQNRPPFPWQRTPHPSLPVPQSTSHPATSTCRCCTTTRAPPASPSSSHWT